MHDDTRQNPATRPGLVDQDMDGVEDDYDIQERVEDLQEIMSQRTSLETYRDLMKAAGHDGLDPLAKQIMLVNLRQLKVPTVQIGMESFGADVVPSLEDLNSWLSDLGQRIKELIEKLIASAKQWATKILSGVDKVKTESENLMDRLRGRKVANELHDDKVITIKNPGLLFADGKFCGADCKSEQAVIKFFAQTWPKYAHDQITRAKKMISEYDIDDGNSENFNANAGFIGNHQSLVTGIIKEILPGNKAIAFKYVALGPELVNAEDAASPPDNYELEVRTVPEINNTLKVNVATMNALSTLFRAESEVLKDMATLSEAVMGLENRRGETIWKSSRASLDEISKTMMDLIQRLKPQYDPIVRHLAAVGNARNHVVRQELDAMGQ